MPCPLRLPSHPTRYRGDDMPSSSHQNCERCHVARTHRRAKYSMCPPCRRAHVAELHEQRQAARRKVDPVREVIVDDILDNMSPAQLLARWQHNVLDSIPLPLPHELMPKVRPVTEGTNRTGRPARLTDEQRLEIGRRYEEGQSYDQIKSALGVSSKTISDTARSLGLPMRGVGSPKQDTPVVSPESGDIPEPQIKALENMLKLPPKPEPLASTPLFDTVHWEVRVEGIVSVHGGSIEEALASVRKLHPALRITGINQAQ